MGQKSEAKLPREAFLSHSSKDRRLASQIAGMLKAHGIAVWYSETHLRGAQQWHDEIGAALGRCDWFVILLSPHATRSRWVKHELLFALRSPRYENRILPVICAACDPSKLSWTLDGFQSVDFTGDFDAACKPFLRTWGLRYHKPTPPQRRLKIISRKTEV